jgi:hypothetical protein
MAAFAVLAVLAALASQAPNPACGDAAISELSSARVSTMVHGADTPLVLSASFSPTTCSYSVLVPPTAEGLLKVEVVPESIATWNQPGQLKTVEINGRPVDCFQSEGKCNAVQLSKSTAITVVVSIFNNTKGGPPTWKSEYTLQANIISTA